MSVRDDYSTTPPGGGRLTTKFYSVDAHEHADAINTLITSDAGKVTSGGALGTPSSGVLTNCTFPTLNQNTSGTASNVTGTVAIANGGTGATTLAGAGILVSGGALGTPSSGNASNLTSFPTLNQNTSGTASNVTGTVAVANGGTGSTTAAGALTNLAIPADFMLVQVGNTARATGTGDFAVGHYVGRAFTATKVVYQFDTADASGSTAVELRRNGSQVTSSNLTVTAANQADGTGTDSARAATISQSFSVGDRINLQITSVGTTPGKGLRAWVVGTWN